MIRLSRETLDMLKPPAAAGEDLLAERLIPLNEAARLLGYGGRKPSKVTTWRWATKGISDRRGGARIRLETLKVGATRYTSYEAIGRFSAALDGRGGQAIADAVRTPRRRRAEAAAAAARLKAEGFM